MQPLTNLTVVPANHAQKLKWRSNAWDHWFRPANLAYERFHAAQEFQESEGRHALDGGVQIWVLVPRDETGTEDVLAACRTMRRKARHSNSETGEMRDAVSYCITSVVTAPEHRRKGYANRLMSTLHHLLAPPTFLPPWPTDRWGPPPVGGKNDALYSTLWSDVGDTYYRKCTVGSAEEGHGGRDGWVVRLDEELTWDLDRSGGSTHEVELFKKWDFELPHQLVERYETKRLLLCAQNQTLLDGQTGDGAKKHLILDSASSPGVINYYLLRRQTQSASLPPLPTRGEETYGFVHRERGIWAVWCFLPEEPQGRFTLRVTSVGIDSIDKDASVFEDDLKMLIDVVKWQAIGMGCDRITLWGLPTRVKEGWMRLEPRIKSVRREEHLGAIAWYGPGNPDDVHWEGGEEFTWA